ncbi:MAG: class I SAM-dependent methyltransferase [Deltaproteobacteria bacterium]|nr:class I SAM-dependent methyltransferase [Deltaproteobacteria bacterium]
MPQDDSSDFADQFTRLKKTFDTFAELEPFFTVLTDQKFLAKNLSDEHLKDFYQSGRHYIDTVLQNLLKKAGQPLTGGRCFDFGCGLGRIAFALAPHFNSVTGCDISETILDWGRKALAQLRIDNVTLCRSEEQLVEFGYDQFDFVHSYLVFQHMPPPLIRHYLTETVKLIKPAGTAMLHVPAHIEGYTWNQEKARWAVEHESIQMHALEPDDVSRAVQNAGGRIIFSDQRPSRDKAVLDGYYVIRKG